MIAKRWAATATAFLALAVFAATAEPTAASVAPKPSVLVGTDNCAAQPEKLLQPVGTDLDSDPLLGARLTLTHKWLLVEFNFHRPIDLLAPGVNTYDLNVFIASKDLKTTLAAILNLHAINGTEAVQIVGDRQVQLTDRRQPPRHHNKELVTAERGMRFTASAASAQVQFAVPRKDLPTFRSSFRWQVGGLLFYRASGTQFLENCDAQPMTAFDNSTTDPATTPPTTTPPTAPPETSQTPNLGPTSNPSGACLPAILQRALASYGVSDPATITLVRCSRESGQEWAYVVAPPADPNSQFLLQHIDATAWQVLYAGPDAMAAWTGNTDLLNAGLDALVGDDLFCLPRQGQLPTGCQ